MLRGHFEEYLRQNVKLNALTFILSASQQRS